MVQTQQSRGIWAWDLVKFLVGSSLFLFTTLYFIHGFTEVGTREAIRWSARISFICFCIAFAASAAHLFIKNGFSFWWFMNRKYWGVSFAIIHLIHLIFLGVLHQFFHPIFEVADRFALVAGGIAYTFITLMLLTSFEFFSKHITRIQWKALHTIGSYWIWGVYMSSYYKRALTEYGHIPLVIILLIVLSLRLGAVWKRRVN